MISGLGLGCLMMEDTEQKLKKQLLLLGGILMWIAGVLVLVPVSCVACNIIQEFGDEQIWRLYPDGK